MEADSSVKVAINLFKLAWNSFLTPSGHSCSAFSFGTNSEVILVSRSSSGLSLIWPVTICSAICYIVTASLPLLLIKKATW